MKRIIILIVSIIFLIVGCGNNAADNKTALTSSMQEDMVQQDFLLNVEQEDTDFFEEKTQDFIVNTEDVGKTFIDGDYEYTVLEDGTVMISSYAGEDTELTIPTMLGGYQVSQIGTDSFHDKENIKKIIIPGTIKIINKKAFRCPNLEIIVVEEGVERIENNAFNNGMPERLTVTLPKSLTYMGEYVFSIPFGAKDEFFDEENGVYYLGTIAYETKENIETINFRENTTGIAGSFIRRNYNYEATDIDKVVIPEGVKFIGEDAFSNCGVKQFVLPESLQEIGPNGIGYFKMFDTYSKLDIKIYGSEDSYVYRYANEKGFDFVIVN